MADLQDVDPKQTFDKVIINGPTGTKQHTNITFNDLQQNVSKNIQTLLKSSFYKQVTVHMGAHSLTERSYLEQKYKRQEEIIKLKIQETKKSIFKLSNTNDELEFDQAMQNYQNSMNVINARAEQVQHTDFVPIVHIDVQKKQPLYGHLMQEFTRKGAGVLNIKMGYRSPFSVLDTLELKFQTPITSLKRKYFNLDFEWQNIHEKYGNVFTKYSHANESLYRDIDEKSHSFNLGFDDSKRDLRLQWENKIRYPSISQKFDQYCQSNYHLPSHKSSIKLNKVWNNSIQFNDINMGKYLETRGEVTIPLLSKSQFAKFETNYRKFHDPIALKKYFDSQLMKKLLYGSSFQTNASLKVMKPFLEKYVSDFSENMEIRGFDQPRVPSFSYSNFKVSGKFNIHNFPLIGSARLTPFLFAQSGFSVLDLSKQNHKQQKNKLTFYGLGSLGMGVAFYVNQFTQIQVLYCLGQYQNLPRRQLTNFQIRIGVFD